VLAVVDEF
jgi:hypothetical protein